MAEFPALPLFTDAYIADTRHLSTLQHGAYLLLLMTAWRAADCALPDDDRYLARCSGLDLRTWVRNRDAVLAFWARGSDGRLTQKRLLDERHYVEQQRSKKSAAGKASALKRKNRGSTQLPTQDQHDGNTHTHTHTHTQSSSAKAESLEGFESVYRAATEMFPKLATSSTAPIQMWLAAGCMPDLIIGEMKRAGGKPIGSFSYFTNGIMDAKATLERGPPKGQARPQGKAEAPKKNMKQF